MFKKILFFVICFILINSFSYAAVKFTWDANTESDLAGYKLYQKTDDSQYFLITDAIPKDANTYQINNPIEYGTYYWVLTAYDEHENESGYSNEASYTFEDDDPPTNPSGFKYTIDNNTVNININFND